MKATIDIPDDLYRRVKAKSALLGLAVREVTIDLYRKWVSEEPPGVATSSAEEWLDDWVRFGEKTLPDDRPESTATEILADDRGRLDRRGR